jgi:hypothetical protein
MYLDRSFDDTYISRYDCTQLQLDDVATKQFCRWHGFPLLIPPQLRPNRQLLAVAQDVC